MKFECEIDDEKIRLLRKYYFGDDDIVDVLCSAMRVSVDLAIQAALLKEKTDVKVSDREVLMGVFDEAYRMGKQCLEGYR